MKYSLVFSSHTGNTAKLAETIRATLPEEYCSYFGEPSSTATDAPLVFVGFWTDKGSCDAGTASFLKGLMGKQVFLFGTAGFGGSDEYFDKILSSARGCLDSSNSVVGSFMCQGRMPMTVRERYMKMLTGGSGDSRINEMLENFDSAATHPNQDDLERLVAEVCSTVNKI